MEGNWLRRKGDTQEEPKEEVQHDEAIKIDKKGYHKEEIPSKPLRSATLSLFLHFHPSQRLSKKMMGNELGY